jgi:HEAT repeat protein
MPVPGLSQRDPGTRNVGGALMWRELAAVANSDATPETRALAIRALALVKTLELREIMRPWLKAPETPVRAAAVLLFADFAARDPHTVGQFDALADDPSPAVRKCTAYAIGFTQYAEIVPVLSRLLKDKDAAVLRAATESLRSFDPKFPAVAAALKLL